MELAFDSLNPSLTDLPYKDYVYSLAEDNTVDLSYISKEVEVTGDTLQFSKNTLSSSIGSNPLTFAEMAYNVVGYWLRYKPTGRLRIHLNNIYSKNPDLYCPLSFLAAQLGDNFILDCDDEAPDVDYAKHCYLAYASGLLKPRSLDEKKAIFPYGKGSVVCLHTKGGTVTPQSPYGYLSTTNVGVIQNDPAVEGIVKLLTYPLTGTIEDNAYDFTKLSHESRDIFQDLLDVKARPCPAQYALTDLGIDLAFFDEPYLLTGFSQMPFDKTEARVYTDEGIKALPLQEADLMYWILKEYQIPFDEERYFLDNPVLAEQGTLWDKQSTRPDFSYLQELRMEHVQSQPSTPDDDDDDEEEWY